MHSVLPTQPGKEDPPAPQTAPPTDTHVALTLLCEPYVRKLVIGCWNLKNPPETMRCQGGRLGVLAFRLFARPQRRLGTLAARTPWQS